MTDTDTTSPAGQPDEAEQSPIDGYAANADAIANYYRDTAIAIKRGIRDGYLDSADLDRWEDLQRTQAGSYYAAGEYSGAKRLIASLVESGGMSKADAKNFYQRLDNIARGTPDEDFAADLATQIRGASETGLMSTATRTPTAAQTKASQRKERELLMDPKTPIFVLKEIRARQKASGQ